MMAQLLPGYQQKLAAALIGQIGHANPDYSGLVSVLAQNRQAVEQQRQQQELERQRAMLATQARPALAEAGGRNVYPGLANQPAGAPASASVGHGGISGIIRNLALQRGLDPAAVPAVAAQEGLGGGIGDNGTSFGPFQLHYGGAYPSHAPRGAGASQAWAMSPQGIAYALDQIAHVARGLHGRAAIENIVRRFERPANPDREVANALGAYGR